jgi:uroporphyrin-III C-methyltransferase
VSGKVYLVGAGPGDPELLTLKAVRVLGLADVVLHDALVSKEVLAHARPGARRIPVGKRGGCRSTPQEFIERLMVAEALRGKVVVRLKGGDPMMFGRGGEECEMLRAHGIDHEVVNGITSGFAAATAAGIAITHRAHGHGAVFVTGHDPDGVDWAALARVGMPLVVYMAATRLAVLERALLAAGFAPGTPVRIVENASRRNQRQLTTRVGSMAADAEALAIASPAIALLGGPAVRESKALRAPATQPRSPRPGTAARSRRD